jgi:hypothetical protein
MEAILKHEWDTRLGTIGYNFQNQAKSIEDFINMFEDRLSEQDKTMLRRIARDASNLSKDIKIVETRCDENTAREDVQKTTC